VVRAAVSAEQQGSKGKMNAESALATVLESGEVMTRLRLHRLGQEDRWINAIRSSWSNCEVVPRNPAGTHENVELQLEDMVDGRRLTLRFPDLNGETFRDQWTTRTTTNEFRELADRASGLLLFIHPDRVFEPWQIRDQQELMGVLGDDAIDRHAEGDEANAAVVGSAAEQPTSEKEWDPAKAPTQVQLVDVLQHLLPSGGKTVRKRVTVIVSAWDLLRKLRQPPHKWLERRMPLLFQYLRATVGRDGFRVFGVSATGGNIENNEDRARLLQQDRCDRIEVAGEGVTNSHDITEPMRCLINR
jgi:hypothetical protein